MTTRARRVHPEIDFPNSTHGPMPRRPLIRPARVPTAPIAIIAVVVLASILSGHPALIALVPVLVFLIVRRLAGGRGAGHPGDHTP